MRQVHHVLVRGPAEVHAARERVRGVVDGWGIGGDLVDDLLVCVSEAVTNAVRYAGGEPVTVALTRTGSGMRVEVADGEKAWPRLLSPRETVAPVPEITALDEHGRGLFLLAALASRWGVSTDRPTGKRVWFELDVPTLVPVAVPR